MTKLPLKPRRWRYARWFYLAVSIIASGLLLDWWWGLPPDAQATYVGGQQCAECHLAESTSWHGSDHDRAMQIVTDETVLGDFEDVSLEHFGFKSTMYRDQGRFMVRTQGATGDPESYEVKYTFGVRPLQQYLVETQPAAPHLPTMEGALRGHGASERANAIGRLQVLPLCWDTEQQQWFYLSPPDVDEAMGLDEPVFWMNYGQNWNHMCAVCHSTNLHKNFDVQKNAFATTYSDLNVHCESCHGPGSLHIRLARAKSPFWDRRRGRAIMNFRQADSFTQIQACAPCHSRRQSIAADSAPGEDYYDHYLNSLIEPGLYYPDGQIRDEVYVYGSFLQSKMYAEGIRCTDCHQPHSLTLKHEGNALCTSCHQHSAAKYDTVAHHRHAAGSQGALCVECHMPSTAYMDVDWRRDHSMSIPRPDLSLELNTPNACTRCHLSKELKPDEAVPGSRYAELIRAAENGDAAVASRLRSVDQWAVEALAEWSRTRTATPSDGEQDLRGELARALNRAWNQDSSVASELLRLASSRKLRPIQRASALCALNALEFDRNASMATVKPLLRDKDVQVRIAAMELMAGSAQADQVESIAPLLNDPRRAVRVTAARILAATPERLIPREYRAAKNSAIDEYRRALESDADQAGAHMALAAIDEQQGTFSAAERACRRAIQVQPLVTGPRSNLAQLLERRGDSAGALQLRTEELKNLARDARLLPNNVQVLTRYGFCLHLTGDTSQAVTVFEQAYELEPTNEQTTYFLALLYQRQNQPDKARALAEQLIQMDPTNKAYLELRAQSASE